MAVIGNAFDINLVRRILSYAKPYKNFFLSSIVLTVLLALISPVRPYLIEFTVNHYILHYSFTGLWEMTLLMLFLLGVQSLIQYAHSFLTNSLGQSVIKDLRIETFNIIIQSRLKFFDKTPLGQLNTRTISDLETIADVFSDGLIEIVGSILQIIALVGFMAFSDWKLTLVVLTPIPILFIGTLIFQKSIKKAFTSVRTEVAALNSFLQEHITGISLIQIFSREYQEMEKFKKINRRYREANINSNFSYSIFFPFVEVMAALSMGLLIWFGAKGIMLNEISPGVVVSFLLYINLLFRPIRDLADKFNTLQLGMVSAGRIFYLLDHKEFTPDEGQKVLSPFIGKIEFDHVWFAYNEQDYVLKNLSFTVNPGETIAFVGATGAGKSSIIQILSRFYEINSGSIRLDGIDIREIPLSVLRSLITTVQQDVFLFSDTIGENIRMGDLSISDSEIKCASSRVGADEFIERLPGNYEYNVMERGGTLSLGQAQMLSFIRALVHNPIILVLDEATSSVDSETEEMIQNAILKLMENRTSILIAHRLSTIQHADNIIVLDKGEIKEMGAHQELLKMGGAYKRLYDLQFGSEGILGLNSSFIENPIDL